MTGKPLPDEPGAGTASIQVVAGSPTDEETAAIAALFTHLAVEEAVSPLPLPTAPVRSAWDRSARPMRVPFATEKDWRDS